jgi:predicted PurR-regulated permease PerM
MMDDPGRPDRAAATGDLPADALRIPDRLAALQGVRLYKAIGLLFLAALVFRFFDPVSRVLLIAFVGIVVAMALNAIVVRIPLRRGFATILVALAVFLILGLATWLGIRWILPQLRSFIADLPDVRRTVERWESEFQSAVGVEIEVVGGVTETLLENPFAVAMSLLTQAFGVLEIFGLAVLVFFGAIFAVARPNEQLLNPLLRTIPRERRPVYRRMLKRMAERLVGWLRGTLISMLIIGAVSGLAFWAIGVPYALLLGVWVGLIEVIPVVGPWIGGATVVLVTLVFQPDLLLWVVIAILGIQQLEGNVVRPFVMSGAAELHPFATLLGLLLFGAMFGLLGALLALPLLLAIATAIEVLWVEETIGTDQDDIEPLVEVR